MSHLKWFSRGLKLSVAMRLNEINGANAGGRRSFRFSASWAARIAHFRRWPREKKLRKE